MTTASNTPPVPPLPRTESATTKTNVEAKANEVVTSTNVKASNAAQSSMTPASSVSIAPATQTSPFSSEKVAALKRAIEEGVFEVDVQNIADKLLRDMPDIFKDRKPSE